MIQGSLAILDYVVLVGYFGVLVVASAISMLNNKRNTIDSYFLAGRQMTWIFIGASLFACNIGSEHFIGLAGSGAASGISVGAFELNAMVLVQLLGWVFLPVYIGSGVATLPEYMNKRFGGNRIRIYLSALSLVLYIFTKISVNLYSGGLFIKLALGWNLYYSILFVLALTALCTITGGLKAVIYIDLLQSIIMVVGGLVLMVFSFNAIGGLHNLYPKYMNSSASYINTLPVNSTLIECAAPKANSFQMLRGLSDSELPWLGFFLGQTPASIWYWCSDQMTVQRTLAAKSLSHAQGGTLLAGYLKVLPLFMMVIPGMISRVLFPTTVGCVEAKSCLEACDSATGCSNIAYPMLIMNILPDGMKGLLLAVMLAALMSDLTSIFNSSATLFTCDIYQFFKRSASNTELMIVGRLFIVFMVAVGIVWIPVIQNMQGAQLYIYIQSVSAYLSPPIAAIFLLAVLWKRTNEKGAFWGLMTGMVLGSLRMIIDFTNMAPPCGQTDNRPFIVKDFHYMYFAMSLFFLVGAVAIVISARTEQLPQYRIIRTTFWTRKVPDKRPDELDHYKALSNPITNVEIEAYKLKEQDEVKQIKESSFFISAVGSVFGLTDLGDEEKEQSQQREEAQRRADTFESLNQTRWEKVVLNINLVFICLSSAVLYILFSLPDEYSIWK